MSKIMLDLQGLIVPKSDVWQGTITGIAQDVITISSPNGVRNFKVANPGSFNVGNKVRYQGNLFLGRVTDEAGIPHFSV
jgi:hypothetical protein